MADGELRSVALARPTGDITTGENDFRIKNVNLTVNASPVPEPETMLLLGTGLIGLAGVGRKKFFNKR